MATDNYIENLLFPKLVILKYLELENSASINSKRKYPPGQPLEFYEASAGTCANLNPPGGRAFAQKVYFTKFYQ